MNKSLYLYVNGLSELGSRMEIIVISSIIYASTGSTLWLSGSLAARVIGGLLSSLSSGNLADRKDRKKLMILSDVLRALVVLCVIPFPRPEMFVLASFLLGFLGSYFQVSFSASIPQIFGEERILEVNSLIYRMSSFAMVIGYLGGGVIADHLGYKSVLTIDALSFVLSAATLMRINWNSLSNSQQGQVQPKEGILSDLREVKRYVSLQPVFLIPLVVSFVMMLGSSSHNVGIPMLAAEIDVQNQASLNGMIWAVEGLGCVLITLLLPRFRWMKDQMLVPYLLVVVMHSVAYIATLSSSSLWYILPFVFIAGWFDAADATLFSSIMQKTDNFIRGRIFGLLSLLNRLGFLLGFVIVPLLLEVLSLQHMVWILHGFVVISVLVVICWMLAKKISLGHVETAQNRDTA